MDSHALDNCWKKVGIIAPRTPLPPSTSHQALHAGSNRNEKARDRRGQFREVTRAATADEEAIAARDMGTRGRQWGLAS